MLTRGLAYFACVAAVLAAGRLAAQVPSTAGPGSSTRVPGDPVPGGAAADGSARAPGGVGSAAVRPGDAAAAAAAAADSAAADSAGGPADAGLCTEDFPAGKERPRVRESFPSRGESGHAAFLEVVLEHGKGETVLPDGFQFQLAGDQVGALEQRGFVLPHPDGGAGPSITRVDEGTRAKTTVRLGFVLLPKEVGRQTLTLPPLPIAIARASGELLTLCTRAHAITVESPIANSPDPKPKANPEARPQREEWTTLKLIVYSSLVALLVGALAAWLFAWWWRRPRPQPPPAASSSTLGGSPTRAA